MFVFYGVHMHVNPNVCGGQRTIECHSLSSFFETSLPLACKLLSRLRWLSSVPRESQLRDYKHMPTCLLFQVSSGDPTQVFMHSWQELYLPKHLQDPSFLHISGCCEVCHLNFLFCNIFFFGIIKLNNLSKAISDFFLK